MTTLTTTQARTKLYKLVDETAATHEPIQIAGKRASAILISEEDWRAIQETLYLLSIPGMRESIRDGMRAPINKCSSKLRVRYKINDQFSRGDFEPSRSQIF